MKGATIQWLILAVGVVLLARCRQDQPVAVKISPVPPAQPFVFYDETGEPSENTAALSEAELREIIHWVATQTPNPVWLIRVRPSLGDGTRNSTVAYLVPDEATSRIRVGRAYDVPASKSKTAICSPWTYAQVSMPDHSFTERFTKPSVTEMPFEWRVVADPNLEKFSPMSKENVVSIVDFVRRRANGTPIVGSPLGYTIARASAKLPILRINDMGEKIGVTFGYLHEPLWGHGVGVMIKRTRSGYKLLDWSYWIS